MHQFLFSICSNTLYASAYVLSLELTTKEYNIVASSLHAYFYVVGELIVLSTAYYFRDWKVTNWSFSILSTFILLLSLAFLPESPSWLVTKKRYKDAGIFLIKIAKTNNKRINLTVDSFVNVTNDKEFYSLFSEFPNVPSINDTENK